MNTQPTYLGHLPDGSSVQRHSAGGAYPFVVFARENDGRALLWGVLGPGIDGELTFADYDDATTVAAQLKACRDSADAWSFNVERLVHTSFGGQRHLSMVDAMRAIPAQHFGGRCAFEQLSMTERVRALVLLAQTRRLCVKWESVDRRPLLSQGVLS